MRIFCDLNNISPRSSWAVRRWHSPDHCQYGIDFDLGRYQFVCTLSSPTGRSALTTKITSLKELIEEYVSLVTETRTALGNAYVINALLHHELDIRRHRDVTLKEVSEELARQNLKWGEQNHPDGTGEIGSNRLSRDAKRACQTAASKGKATWLGILKEEFREAGAESDPALLRAELIQVAAVAVQWVAAIDRRSQ